MKPHQLTNLKNHIKTFHFWIDFILLSSLWIILYFLPENLIQNNFINLKLIAKIVTGVATLEILAFFSAHLFTYKTGIIFQGLLGGIISSTSVFLRLTQFKSNHHLSSENISLGLISATISMLFECLLIVFAFLKFSNFQLISLFLVQFLFLIVILIYKNLKSKSDSTLELFTDHPIVWINVLQFALLIFFLIIGMRFIHFYLNKSSLLATFIMSLFEAHGVLVAILNESIQNNQLQILLFAQIVLTGNWLSKTLIILKATSLKNKLELITILSIATSLSWSLYFIYVLLS